MTGRVGGATCAGCGACWIHMQRKVCADARTRIRATAAAIIAGGQHLSFSVASASRGGREALLKLYSTDTPSGLKPFMLLAFPVTPLDVLLSAQHHAWDEKRKALKAAGPSWPPSPIPGPSAKDAAVVRLGYVRYTDLLHPFEPRCAVTCRATSRTIPSVTRRGFIATLANSPCMLSW